MNKKMQWGLTVIALCFIAVLVWGWLTDCPNTAIYQGAVEYDAVDGSKQAALSDDFFYIVPEKCTECVGFFDQEQCAAVCPVDCCVPNPDIPETEEVLLERAKELHPDTEIPEPPPSRFRA